jgi:division protein CdvB (Snf7/Vps24/ESCRT-III family)
MLSDTVMSAGGLSTREINVEATEEAQKIIQEANVVAEQRIKEHFPELPTGLPIIPEDLQKASHQEK